MKYKILPHFWIEDLEQALEAQYGTEFIEEVGDLRNFLFNDYFSNDASYQYRINELEEYEGKPWQNETRIRLENCIKTFLIDIFPGYEMVVIDVTW